jgi:hypothetical protein
MTISTARSFFADDIALESERSRRLFTVSGWNTVIRAAGQSAGIDFLVDYVPLRWNKGYAVSQLQYAQGRRTPFYTTGDWLTAAEAGSNVRAVATKGDVQVRVSVPLPHPVRAETAAAFKRVTQREKDFIRKQFRAHLVRFIEQTPVITSKRINGRARAQVDKALTASSKSRARSLSAAGRLSRVRELINAPRRPVAAAA